MMKTEEIARDQLNVLGALIEDMAAIIRFDHALLSAATPDEPLSVEQQVLHRRIVESHEPS